MSVVCSQVEVSASGWSPVQRSPTECGVFECDGEVSIMRRTWFTRGCLCYEGGGGSYTKLTHFTWTPRFIQNRLLNKQPNDHSENVSSHYTRSLWSWKLSMWQKMDNLSDGARNRLFARNFLRNKSILLEALHCILIMMMLWIELIFQLDILLFGTQRSRINFNCIKWLQSNGKHFD